MSVVTSLSAPHRVPLQVPPHSVASGDLALHSSPSGSDVQQPLLSQYAQGNPPRQCAAVHEEAFPLPLPPPPPPVVPLAAVPLVFRPSVMHVRER